MPDADNGVGTDCPRATATLTRSRGPSCELAGNWLFIFSGVWSRIDGEMLAGGRKIASKSQGSTLKKPAMTLKERRAAKREKMAQETVVRRKKPNR